MTANFHKSQPKKSIETLRLVSKIKNLKKRNLLRGYLSKTTISNSDVEQIRASNSPHDSKLIGAILKGKSGILKPTPKISDKKSSADLYTLIQFPAIEWRNEICYTAGYVNSQKSKTIECIQSMDELIGFDAMEPEESLAALLKVAQTHGASNYLAYKLAYIRSAKILTSEALELVTRIESEISHRNSPGLLFSALENLSSRISLFVVARRRISGLSDKVMGDFRKSLSLSNFIPTPLGKEDVPGFLLRATESSLMDTIHAIIVTLNLEHSLEQTQDELSTHLDPEILGLAKQLIGKAREAPSEEIVTDQYRSQNIDSYPSLDLYRISTAFLERPEFARYRNKLDKIIGARLLADFIENINQTNECTELVTKTLLLAPCETVVNKALKISLDTFYRTYLFLNHINTKANLLDLREEDIKFIFENTVGLEVLLTEKEIRTLHLMAPPETKGLVTVLALALHRKKSVDPDIDFEFRSDFINHIKAAHNGSILEFINFLLTDSPAVANYITSSLDEVTLEKMYTLVENASAASKTRGDILRAVGQKLNRIEYFIEADAISTRAEVSKLQQYFDSSRMYVDSVAMQKWLDSNPTISTEQYRSLYRGSNRVISRVESSSSEEGTILVLHIEDDDDEYLIQQIAKDAFEQFCLNTEFGIQSYLGRRIRHNTLQGVMIETVDAVLNKPEHQATTSTIGMRNSIHAWLGAYNAIIEKLKRDQLQFKSSSSLFKSTLDFDDAFTKENIRKLSANLRSTGGAELLNDLVISFCWKQIAPQLENASRFIKTNLLNEANNSIDHYFTRSYATPQENRLKADLHDAVNEVFKKVASWFQVPQTGFISASIRDICQIILIDLNRALTQTQFIGSLTDRKYTGISVHRIYDCLAVLLQNACKHGEENSTIEVNVSALKEADGPAFDNLCIKIKSIVAKENYESSKTRIAKAIESEETGADMVTEGYTGIKKIKFITRATEGIQTINWSANDQERQLTLEFTIHAEQAPEEINKAEPPR